MSIEENCAINLGVVCSSAEGGVRTFRHQDDDPATDDIILTLRDIPAEADIKVGDKFYVFLHRTDNPLTV
jgi:hypothetical protein